MYKKDMRPIRRGPLPRNPVGKLSKKVSEKRKGTFPLSRLFLKYVTTLYLNFPSVTVSKRACLRAAAFETYQLVNKRMYHVVPPAASFPQT